MRIKCNRCGQAATIQSSTQISDEFKQLYCSCTNTLCGHTFVMDLAFSHTLSPSAVDIPPEALAKIRKGASRCEQREMFQVLQAG
ncbi:ogr/Delta-like zinc finger family protein [Desulfoluna spongiiphila]|uniref:Ogr/Delta-like zinc finger n=1 Tax=Desulfoluna spongiiphila TaxID=419481 RepID=A0A1G5G3T5_9BACT|nr:ogr/Delta-like zinc finger family protein [Desulfoluna spongiiphila]SCY46162.1 Ogr/Delta-like zinc finger [Desulfoluna spongiiphila]VVS91055.1 zinc finger ogr/delta-type [Desulfoluna spongiiphila]